MAFERGWEAEEIGDDPIHYLPPHAKSSLPSGIRRHGHAVRDPLIDHGIDSRKESRLFGLDVTKDVDEGAAIRFECMSVAFNDPDNA